MNFQAPIGSSLPRDRAKRLLAGRGQYVDDIQLPRMLHLAFVRSPYPHARVKSIETIDAVAMPGVARVVKGADLVGVVSSWRGTHNLFPGLKAPEQHVLAGDTARWQGEAVAAVAARSRAEAEDAAEQIVVDWEELPFVGDAEVALENGATFVHDSLGSNQAFAAEVKQGNTELAFQDAHLVIERRFRFNRHTGVSLESRGLIADYDPSADRLTVYQSHQTPHQQQDLYARLLDIPEQNVRVICPDVGGAFGLKHHLYPDELAACAISKLLERPVKYIADRFESFLSDIHCRDHTVTARMAFTQEGDIVGMQVDDLFHAGAYSQYPRSSIAEGNQIIRLCGIPYRHEHYRAAVRMAYLNKSLLGHIRSVGHPIACAVTEQLVDLGAKQLSLDPVAMRRRAYLRDEDFPTTSPGGIALEHLSFHGCLDRALERIDVDAFRREQAQLREQGIYRGIGFATFVDLTSIGPEYYGEGGQHISAQETCLLRLEASGGIRCYTGATDQGQGIDSGIQQVVAGVIGVPVQDVKVNSGDSELCPVGGGSWGSRGAALAGEAALRAGQELRRNILNIAGVLLQKVPELLDIRDGAVVDATSGAKQLALAEVAQIGHFRPYMVPDNTPSDLTVTGRYASRDRMFLPANGLHVAILDVDTDTGLIVFQRYLVVHDCGRLLNPLLVEEQIRGGVVQGIGGALYEEFIYDDDGYLCNGTLADYLVPMAAEMPDIEVEHLETPTATSELGAKGAGEAGTTGAMGAVLNAVNDALTPFDVTLSEVPLTPPRILRALGKI
ncbi:MAG: molybdopterin-dependent oxidoreductase [Alphaproteobacteria bacterium]|nr:molybdopterin-dependent oxidoreductase [Alphaproteobacteria bacterium]